MISFDDTDYGEIDLMKGLLAGVAGGLLASYLMEQFQAAWSAASDAMSSSQKRGGRKPDPATVKAANLISEKVTGHKLAQDYKSIAGEAMHYGMGASSAAVYGLLAEVAPIVTIGNGAGFGTGGVVARRRTGRARGGIVEASEGNSPDDARLRARLAPGLRLDYRDRAAGGATSLVEAGFA